ncbi:MAG: GNAT family N-acetyltransferase [Fibrobacter sp.]|nr:GNAT family N-acetyltransferase [Fibrobacter sp.]
MTVESENFDDIFAQKFSAETLTGNLATLVGLREEESGPFSLDNIQNLIENSKEFLSEHLPWVDTYTIEEIKSRVRGWIMAEKCFYGCCWGIIKTIGKEQKLAGFIMIEVFLKNRSATLSYWLGKDFAGQGIMSEAVGIVSEFAFEKLGLNRLELSTAVNNPKSAAVAKRCGFTQEGICRAFEFNKGAFIDHIRFSKLASDNRLL